MQSVPVGTVAGSIYSNYLLHATFILSFTLQQVWADRSKLVPMCNSKPCEHPTGCPNAPSSIIQHLQGGSQRFLSKEKTQKLTSMDSKGRAARHNQICCVAQRIIISIRDFVIRNRHVAEHLCTVHTAKIISTDRISHTIKELPWLLPGKGR